MFTRGYSLSMDANFFMSIYTKAIAVSANRIE